MALDGRSSGHWTDDHPFEIGQASLAPDILYEDVRIDMRDGVVLAASVYRPLDAKPVPVIVTATPYGKDNFDQWRFFKDAPVGNLPSGGGFYMGRFAISDHTPFEAPDPNSWVPHGYAVVLVDHPGLGASGSNMPAPPMQERWADVMAWLEAQAWCTGSVGMLGVSALCCTQWIAAESPAPPQLKAIIPWEGFTTSGPGNGYGGIPESAMMPWVGREWIGPNVNPHAPGPEPLLAGWSFACDQIEVPALVCASTSDQELHSWDTFAAWGALRSPDKWLISHRRPKWEAFYGEQQQQLQRAFFERFLKGDAEAFHDVRAVSIDVHETRSEWTRRQASSWPIPGTQLLDLYPDAGGGLTDEFGEPASVTLVGPDDKGVDRWTFEWTCPRALEVVGHAALHLSVSAESPRIDLFVAVEKVDANGNEVFFFSASGGNANGPVTRGWLRSDFRGIDDAVSTDSRPVRLNSDLGPMTKGQRFDLAIPLMPMAVSFRAGDSIRLAIQSWSAPGRWDGGEGREWQAERSAACNILTGVGTATRLVLPIVPQDAWQSA